MYDYLGTMITTQVHDKFKIFTGKPAKDKTIGKLADEVAAFAKKSKVAAKGIGVEYLESGGQLLITLGYRDDGFTFPPCSSSKSAQARKAERKRWRTP